MEEKSTNSAQNPDALQSTEKQGSKQGNGLKIVTVICALLAVAGLGFGVYEYLQANQAKQQIADLKVEIKNSDGSTTTLETDKIEVKEDNKTVVISDSAATAREEGYFYFDNWGIKVKIPEEFYITGVRTIQRVYGIRNINGGSYDFWGGIRAENSDSLWAADIIDHADYPLFNIGRYDKELYEAEVSEPDSYRGYIAHTIKLFEDDNFTYAIYPAYIYAKTSGAELGNGYEHAAQIVDSWYANSEAFFDPSNYSAI